MNAFGRAHMQRFFAILASPIQSRSHTPVAMMTVLARTLGLLTLDSPNNSAVDPTRATGDLCYLRMVEDRGSKPAERASASVKARIIDAGIKIHEAATQIFVLAPALPPQSSDAGCLAPATSQIICPKRPSNALAKRNRTRHPVPEWEQERQALHQMAGIAAQALTLQQRVTHQTEIACSI